MFMASHGSSVIHIAALLAACAAGCVTPIGRTPAAQRARPGSFVVCLTPHMTGNFGDNTPEWTGTFYIKNNLLIVQHIPTQTEFYIRVFTLTGSSPFADGRETSLHQIRYAAHGGELVQTNVTVRQHVAPFSKPGGAVHTESFQYVFGSFSGQRYETDAYSRRDQVETTVYVTCLETNAAIPRRSLYFGAVAMVPPDVSAAEKQRMLRVLERFLEDVTLYKDQPMTSASCPQPNMGTEPAGLFRP